MGAEAIEAMSVVFDNILRFYQILLSPFLPPFCRFEPSCSAYMRQAVRKWGVCRGAYLGLRRLSRCHPLNFGGIDPVP